MTSASRGARPRASPCSASGRTRKWWRWRISAIWARMTAATAATRRRPRATRRPATAASSGRRTRAPLGGADMADKRIGIYPGTFDPVTNGHVDIIRRAARLVDKLIVAVSVNAGKGPAFTVKERAALLKDEIADTKNGLTTTIEVVSFDSLLMHFAEQVKAKVIIRGLRAVSDF